MMDNLDDTIEKKKHRFNYPECGYQRDRITIVKLGVSEILGQLATHTHMLYFSGENDDGPWNFEMPYFQTYQRSNEEIRSKTCKNGEGGKTHAFEFIWHTFC